MGERLVMTYAIDDKVQITRRDSLTIQKTVTVLDSADTPAGLLHDHHLLDHLFLVGVQEVGELLGIERGVELQETAKGGDGSLSPDV